MTKHRDVTTDAEIDAARAKAHDNVLDGNANTITVMSANGNTHPLSFTGASLAAPSALVSSAGSQSFVIANIGDGNSNSLIYLNGNSATLAFGSQATNSTSQTQTATVADIGNQNLTLSRPSYTITNSNRAFSILPGRRSSNRVVALIFCRVKLLRPENSL